MTRGAPRRVRGNMYACEIGIISYAARMMGLSAIDADILPLFFFSLSCAGTGPNL